MKKPIKCKINKITPDKWMCLAPVGLYCNNALDNASVGDIVDFEDGWRKERVVITRKCHISVNSAAFTFLLKSIYGDSMTWEKLKGDWSALCVNEGLGADAFSDKETLLLEYRPYDKYEHKAEQEAKRKLEELVKKEKAREKLLADASRGVFSHIRPNNQS